MIITKRKSIEDILRYLRHSKKVFIVGCAQCATVCKTGGEEEVTYMEGVLKKEGKHITGKAVLDPVCHLVRIKQFYVKNKESVSDSDCILVMACGNGAQSVMDGTKGKIVYPALDTIFLGKVERSGHFSQNCLLCGKCIIDETGGICPITICAKGLLNGPCGGSKEGKCETDRERDCCWTLIYKRLKELGEVEKMKAIKLPKDNANSITPQKMIIKSLKQ